MELTVLVGAIVATGASRGQRRAFWMSFAMAGWAYHLLIFSPGSENGVGRQLLTSRLLIRADESFHGKSVVAVMDTTSGPTPGWLGRSKPDVGGDGIGDMWVLRQPYTMRHDATGNPIGATPRALPSCDRFYRISQSSLTLASALVGGVLSRAIHALSQSQRGTQPRGRDLHARQARQILALYGGRKFGRLHCIGKLGSPIPDVGCRL